MLMTADARGRTDGTAHNFLQRVNSEVPIVLVSRVEDLQLNEAILNLDKYVLIDYVELGWDWNRKYGHKWGENTDKFHEVFRSDDWKRFDEFVVKNPPLITFQRELLKKDVTDTLVPIAYPCFLPPEPTQNYDQFNGRPIQTIFSWGLSHEYRKTLHGDIWKEAGRYGYSVCDNLFYLQGFLQHEGNHKKWMTLNIPHYYRLPMEQFMPIHSLAKISISIAGAGRNCFRHCESPVNSVMLMWNDELAWHDDWIDGFNCIKCKQGEEIATINYWLTMPEELYDIYLNGVAEVDKYRFNNYIPHIENLIKKA